MIERCDNVVGQGDAGAVVSKSSSDSNQYLEAGRSPIVAIVIVNWNGCADTLSCLKSLESLNYGSWHAIVVDNGSTDDSAERLIASDRVEVIYVGENVGWAAGCNIGIERAIARSCPYVFLLNNDAVPAPAALARLVQAAEGAPVGIACFGAVPLSPDAAVVDAEVNLIDERTGIADRVVPLSTLTPNKDGLVEVAFVSGCALFLSTATWRKVGPFDESFFLYCEESDWCQRASLLGMRSVYVKSAHVVHRAGSTTGGPRRPLQAYFAVRNRLRVAARYGSRKQFLFALRWTYWGLKAASIEEGFPGFCRAVPRSARLQAMTGGLIDYFLRRSGDCPTWVRRLHQRQVLDEAAALTDRHLR
jgi:GT2 family glycosyltransferase